ncbi:MAG: tol-pal system-associated acyl-CoA thioesterase [Betaproteobacteria bacterium]|nr:tol-pal system-associated acyl-CoA thioesterase [Betaproteobacteria bacterium]
MKPDKTQPKLPSFHLPVRVYYDDTDAGGVIYYANYLRFFERCRAEWMREIGFDQATLLHEHGIAFVVRAVSVEYLAPGRLDDLLEIGLEIEKVGRTQIVFRHRVLRREGEALRELVTSTARLVCVVLEAMKTTALPDGLRAVLESMWTPPETDGERNTPR